MNIGNRSTISFELFNHSGGLLNLNFYLGNKLISSKSVHAPTYAYSFEKNLKQLRNEEYQNERLKGLTSTQIIRTIEAERETDQTQFFSHLLQIDETIDQYSIYVLEKHGTTSFNWYCWDENNCNSEHELNEIYAVEVSTSQLISNLERLISELRKERTKDSE